MLAHRLRRWANIGQTLGRCSYKGNMGVGLHLCRHIEANNSSYSLNKLSVTVVCDERGALREITVGTLVSTLTRQGRHNRDRLVTLRRKKQGYFSETNPMHYQRGSSPGRMHNGEAARGTTKASDPLFWVLLFISMWYFYDRDVID